MKIHAYALHNKHYPIWYKQFRTNHGSNLGLHEKILFSTNKLEVPNVVDWFQMNTQTNYKCRLFIPPQKFWSSLSGVELLKPFTELVSHKYIQTTQFCFNANITIEVCMKFTFLYLHFPSGIYWHQLFKISIL